MVVTKIACFTDTTGVETAILMLAQLGHLIAPLRMIAILAHTRGIIVLLRVLALRDHLAMLNLPLSKLVNLPGILAWFLPTSSRHRLLRLSLLILVATIDRDSSCCFL